MGRSRGKRPGSGPLAALATWHRRIGIAAALLVAWLAASGILLNHTDALRLDQRHVGAAWLLDWYGIDRVQPRAAFRAGGHWVTQVGRRIYFDERPMPGEYEHLAGAVALGDEIGVATTERILLLTPDGRLAETLGAAHGVPSGIAEIGVRDARLIARAAHGVRAADAALTAWRTAEAQDVDWARAAELPPPLAARLAADYRARVLTLERVLLDLHSGRLLGDLGVLLIDLAAVAFLLLATTGLWMWLVRNNGRGKPAARGK